MELTGRSAGRVRGRQRPHGVRRRLLSASAVAVVALLAGVVAFTGELRHPRPGDGELAGGDVIGDPRVETTCPDLQRTPAGLEAPAVDRPVEVTSADLLRCPATYHGRQVRYVGEAVGAVLRRGDHAWVQLNDDAYRDAAPLPHRSDYAGDNSGVGARLPAGGADEIDVVGGARRRGDVVAVRGTFYRALPDTADAMVIDATRVERVAAGAPLRDPVLADRRLAALALTALAAAMVAAERVVARRR